MSTHFAPLSAAQARVIELLPNGALHTSSLRIAQDLDARRLADLDPIIAASGLQIGDHQKIQILGTTRAIAHSVDALILARSASEIDDEVPKTLDHLLGLIGAGIAQLAIGASKPDLFLALYAAQSGQAPSQDAPMTEAAITDTLAELDRLCAAAPLQSPAQAAQSTALGETTYALLPFGAAMMAKGEITTSPLRLTTDGAPVALLEWSGWGLPEESEAKLLSESVADTTLAQIGEAHHPAAIWLLDGFSPDARHAGLLETIAAGAALTPLNLWFAELRTGLSSALDLDDPMDRLDALLAL